MVHTDSPSIKIQICNCQSAKLTDSHSCSKQYLDFIQISAEVFVILGKLQKLLLLLWGQCNSFLCVVWDNIQAKLKRIPAATAEPITPATFGAIA